MVDIAVHGAADMMQLAGGDFSEHDGLIFYGYNRIDFDELTNPDHVELPAAAFYPPPRPGGSVVSSHDPELPPLPLPSAPASSIVKRNSRHVRRMDTPPSRERAKTMTREKWMRASPLSTLEEEDCRRLQAAIDLPIGETDSEYESAVSADFDDADDRPVGGLLF